MADGDLDEKRCSFIVIEEGLKTQWIMDWYFLFCGRFTNHDDFGEKR